MIIKVLAQYRFIIKMKKDIVLLVALVVCCISEPAVYKKVIIPDDNAKCLDGSPGAYYISNVGTDPTKFMLFFQGGGWCGDQDLTKTLQSCYQRSKTDLGSSKNYPQVMTVYDGILSIDPNNSFKNFTKVYLKYCDGSGHQGTKSEPINYKGSKLYFRGNNLTISKLQYLQKQHGLFSNATQVLVTGISAGGLGAFTWVDYIRNRTQSHNVYAVPDSGIFLDSANFYTKNYEYKNSFLNIFKISNVQINPPNPQCVKAYPSQPYKCMLVQYLHPYIKSPVFAVQSLYDSWSIRYILGITCVDGLSLQKCSTEQRAYIEEYHKKTYKVLESIGGNILNGYWAPACVNHGYVWVQYYSKDYNIPMRSGNTVDSSVLGWVQEKPIMHHFMDTVSWPDNKPCSGVAQIKSD